MHIKRVTLLFYYSANRITSVRFISFCFRNEKWVRERAPRCENNKCEFTVFHHFKLGTRRATASKIHMYTKIHSFAIVDFSSSYEQCTENLKKKRIYVTFGMLFVESLAHPCIQSFIRLLCVSPLVFSFRVGWSVKFVPRIPLRWTDIATVHESLFVLFFKFEFFVANPFQKCVSFIFLSAISYVWPYHGNWILSMASKKCGIKTTLNPFLKAAHLYFYRIKILL